MAAAVEPSPGPFAQELKRRRIGAQLSQRAAAAECGLTEARWRQVEKGFQLVRGEPVATKPGSDFVISVAQRFQWWPVKEALKLAGYDPKDIVISDEPRIEPPAAMAENWNKIGDRGRKLVKELVDLLADRATTGAVVDTEASTTAQKPAIRHMKAPRSTRKRTHDDN